MDSFVRTKVGNKTKNTTVRRSTDAPYYNEYFVFEFEIGLQTLLDKSVTLTVYRARSCCVSRKMLGYINIDVATIWEQTDHQFYRKWAILSHPKSEQGGPRGYLKVTISVLTSGQSPRIPLVHPFDDDEIEGNLLLPEGITKERHRAMFTFKVYRGVDIAKKEPNMTIVENENPETRISHKKRIKLPNVWFQITFAGMTIKSIANDTAQGFLPCFGPSYVHFYKKDKVGEEYVGKVLLSLETKLYSDTRTKSRSVLKSKISPLLETAIFNFESVLLFIAILNVSIVSKRYSKKEISFEVNWGRTTAFKKDQDLPDVLLPNHITPRYRTKTTDHLYWHIKFDDTVPCLFMVKSYPNARKRLYNANLIDKITTNTKSRLLEIEELLDHRDFRSQSQMIEEKLLDLFDYVAVACRHVIDLMQASSDVALTILDNEKNKFAIYELESIEINCRSAYNPRTKKRSFRRAEKLYKRLEALIDHPQECYPDIFLWMRHGNERVAYLRIPARDAVYSVTPEETGIFCGQCTPLYLRIGTSTKKALSPIACKVDAYIWLGVERSKQHCFESIPNSHTLPKDLLENEIPKFLLPSTSLVFRCRAHVYQGRFVGAFDDSGLSDLFARVMVCEKSARTKVKKATLNPVWDQTLIFQQLIVYGKRDIIEDKPPIVMIEVMEQDRCFQVEYVGRCMMSPVIMFKEDTYSMPKFPPKLKWWDVRNDRGKVGQILAIAELLEAGDEKTEDDLVTANTILSIPADIKPVDVSYRLEVMFWGVRDLKKLRGLPVLKPRVILQCGEYTVSSETIRNTRVDLNFLEPVKYLDLHLPSYEDFVPPIAIKLFDCRSFGRNTYAGTHLASVRKLIYTPILRADWESKKAGMGMKSYDSLASKQESIVKTDEAPVKLYYTLHSAAIEKATSKKKKTRIFRCFRFVCRCTKKFIKCIFKVVFCCCVTWNCKLKKKEEQNQWIEEKQQEVHEEQADDDDLFDWWTKYYASIDDSTLSSKRKDFKITLYDNELEKQANFEDFNDTLTKYHIYMGKTVGEEVEDSGCSVAVLKCHIRMYPWSPSEEAEYLSPLGYRLQDGYFQGFPINDTLGFLVRVYCVRAIKLRPLDLAGKCDSYIVVRMGNQIIDDQKNYVSKNINPVFGTCYELKGTFPMDHSITIAVMDWDRHSHDDVIGKTRIDLENRLYSRHRGHCGLQYEYKEDGPTPWRDHMKPTDIISERCRMCNLDRPEYQANSVRVASRVFTPPSGYELSSTNHKLQREQLALYALHHWNEVPLIGCHLVPEHVETRSLYNKKNPGLEQGKLQLWVDIFPTGDLPPPEMVAIKPRLPIHYQLRVIIWNASDVALNEDDFFGDRKSDIYVKGWLARPGDFQATDVHYRSMTGEGNFNWRFIFDFEYLSMENKITMRNKENKFDIDETEMKIPCRLKLQVWDNDILGKDDFIGSLNLELNKMPRGANDAKKCSLKMLESYAPTINLFKIKRTRGWWPFTSTTKGTNSTSITGKLEAELELLLEDEARASPAGLGRSAPQPLPPPKRPETSFSWFTNPLKTCRFIIWKNLKFKLLKCAIFILLGAFVGLAIYSIPGYTVKKLLHA